MTEYVKVPLSEQTYRQLVHWARLRQQDIGEAIADYLADNFDVENGPVVPPAEPDPDVEREKKAFIRLHPQLKEKYAGQYVAIYQEQLIDHASDYGDLVKRIDARYPDQFVWLAQVEDEPMSVLTFRSPRFAKTDQF